MFELRDYQNVGVMAVRKTIADGNNRPLMVLPTGGGKSVIFGEIIRRVVENNKRVLWLVHRRNLVTQMRDTLQGFGVDAGIIMAGYEPEPDKLAQVGTIFSYARRIHEKKLFDDNFHEAQVVMIDEAHRSVTKSYMDVIERYPHAILVGCTATPLRADGRGLGIVYNDLVEIATVKELTEMGHLSPVRYFAPSTIDTTGIGMSAGDFIVHELAARVNTPTITGDVVSNWLRLGEDRKTIVFAVNVAHSIALRDEFIKYDIPAAHLDAHSSDAERDGVFRAMERGDIKIICNVALYQEGLDVPDVGCIVMARPTKSLGLWKQCAGRGLRPAPGKEDCLILDHGGIIDRLGFLDEEVIWSLDENERGWTKKEPPEKEPRKVTCKECGEIFQGKKICPACQTPLQFFGKKIEATEAELKELDAKKQRKANKDLPWPEKTAFMAALKYYARRSTKVKKEEGWCGHRYKSVFGVWPNDKRVQWKRVPECKGEGKTKNLMTHMFIKNNAEYQKKLKQGGES